MIHHPSFVFLLAIPALIVAGCLNYFRPEKTGIAPSVISITALAMAVGLSMGGGGVEARTYRRAGIKRNVGPHHALAPDTGRIFRP